MNRSILAFVCALMIAGCGTGEKRDEGFFTSGNREADQRADQRMAQDKQLKGDGEGAGEKKDANAKPSEPKKLTLFERLGGERGVDAIVADFVPRVLADPRVNWERKDVKKGGISLSRGKSVEWQPNEQNVAGLKKHLAQFIALATGGPPTYEGREMKQVHAGLHITNAEFDASVGDLKATLDNLGVPNTEQRELLAIIESTRAQVVEQR